MDDGPRQAPVSVHVIALAGGTASGKGHLAQALVQALGAPRVLVLEHDWYYHDLGQLDPEGRAEAVDFDDPASLQTSLLAQHLDELREGRSVEAPVYCFETHRRLAQVRVIEPRPYLLLDGLHVLGEAALRERSRSRLYVEAPDELRLARRIERDTRERGRSEESVRRQWRAQALPAHRRWVQPSRAHAQLVLDGSSPLEALVARVLEHLGLPSQGDG